MELYLAIWFEIVNIKSANINYWITHAFRCVQLLTSAKLKFRQYYLCLNYGSSGSAKYNISGYMAASCAGPEPSVGMVTLAPCERSKTTVAMAPRLAANWSGLYRVSHITHSTAHMHTQHTQHCTHTHTALHTYTHSTHSTELHTSHTALHTYSTAHIHIAHKHNDIKIWPSKTRYYTRTEKQTLLLHTHVLCSASNWSTASP